MIIEMAAPAPRAVCRISQTDLAGSFCFSLAAVEIIITPQNVRLSELCIGVAQSSSSVSF